jgi:hypothetical protein
MFRATPDDLTARLNLQFETGCDQLDYYRRVGLILPSGRRVVINWYERAPEPRGFTLHTDSEDDFVSAREETLAALELDRTAIMWVPENLSPAS